MTDNKFLTKWIIALPIIAVLLTSSILTYEFIDYEKQKLNESIETFEAEYIEELKEKIENRVNRVIKIIEINNKNIYNTERQEIVTVTNIGHNLIKEIYEENKNKTKNEILKIIKSKLENHRFYTHYTSYFFIVDTNNNVIMNTAKKDHERTNQENLQDIKGKYFIRDLTKLVKQKGEGFETWHWNTLGSTKIVPKIGYAKIFEPLGIYIVNSKSLDFIDEKIKTSAKQILDTIQYSNTEYLFALSPNGTTISHINKDYEGQSLESRNPVEQKIMKEIIKIAQNNKAGEFMIYTPTSFNVDDKLSKKISFVKELPSLNWVIGTGQYTKTLEQKIRIEKEALNDELNQTINKITVISISISIILIILLVYISRRLENQLISYEKEVSSKNKKLKELNTTLEKRVLEQIEKNRQKEEILHHQSKLASMGEMLGNIAHQWRQPLSTISTAASGMKIQDEMNTLDKKNMYHSLDMIVESTKILSDTIDDFKNFFKKDKTQVYFNLKDSLRKVFTLIHASFKNKNIEIIQDVCDCELYGLENELTQALLNIISNAKDAVVLNNKDQKRLIKVSSSCSNTHVSINILDNGGGVKEDILDKIFEPYFTTKFKSQGTGIGLYMTRTIIVNHMKGELNVKNMDFEYEGEKYRGANFEIVLEK